MHTALFRANALLTYAGTVLAGLAILATLTDFFHTEHPLADVKLVHVERLQVSEGRNDEAYVACKIDADLSSAFSWNTKQLFIFLAAEYTTPHNSVNQISLWDKIVESPSDAVFKLPFVRNKYRLIDQGATLRGTRLNLTLYWNVLPIVGRVTTHSKTFAADFALPAEPAPRLQQHFHTMN